MHTQFSFKSKFTTLRFHFIWLFCLISITAAAQEVQWASEVVRFSTEYTRKQFAAKQVLGKPDKLPSFGESAVAWAPSPPDPWRRPSLRWELVRRMPAVRWLALSRVH